MNDRVLYIVHCSLHISRLPSALYCVCWLCFVTFNLLYSLYDFSVTNITCCGSTVKQNIDCDIIYLLFFVPH